MPQETKPVGVRLPADVIEALDEMASEQGVFRNDLLKSMITTQIRMSNEPAVGSGVFTSHNPEKVA
jgi:metal-responsive CopG/Arc/MetJ family transcriptional regulator